MYKIYTDGSCLGNGKDTAHGGWAYLIVDDTERIYAKDSSYEKDTTNNRMEMTAIIKGIKEAKEIGFLTFEVCTDSAYVHNCITQKWYEGWIKNDWINSTKKPVKNKDLWEQLIPYFKDENITFSKVKGHSTNKYNNEVDKMAVFAAKLSKEKNK